MDHTIHALWLYVSKELGRGRCAAEGDAEKVKLLEVHAHVVSPSPFYGRTFITAGISGEERGLLTPPLLPVNDDNTC